MPVGRGSVAKPKAYHCLPRSPGTSWRVFQDKRAAKGREGEFDSIRLRITSPRLLAFLYRSGFQCLMTSLGNRESLGEREKGEREGSYTHITVHTQSLSLSSIHSFKGQNKQYENNNSGTHVCATCHKDNNYITAKLTYGILSKMCSVMCV